MNMERTLESWRYSWTRDRMRNELGPCDDADWQEYVNSLSNFELLFNLSIYEQ